LLGRADGMRRQPIEKRQGSKQAEKNAPSNRGSFLHLNPSPTKASDLVIFDKLLFQIAAILEEEKGDILECYYDRYCASISKIDNKQRSVEELKPLCTPIKNRFSWILDRFIGVLRSQTGEYDLKQSEQDEEYALRFVIPGMDKQLDSHYVVEMTEYFYMIASLRVLNKLDPERYSVSREKVLNLLQGLVYLTFEDLWVCSVVAFRTQHNMIQQLLYKVMMVQEQERQNLWREIHDELLQVLGVVRIKLDIVERLSRIDRAGMKRELKLIKAITKKTIQQIRDLGHGFNLYWIERKGFVFSLKRFVELFEREFKIPVRLDLSPRVKNINKFPGVTLFRIIQEALYNVGKHSCATRVKVSIKVLGNEVVVTIEDNGIGFHVGQAKRQGSKLRHLGLVFMGERTKILKGSLEIESHQNHGTRLKVKVPSQSFSEAGSGDTEPAALDAAKRGGQKNQPGRSAGSADV
jgi:signal transduction histidine kinase